MSKMWRFEFVGLVLLACNQILTEHHDYYGTYNEYDHQRYQDWQQERTTRDVLVTQGRLRGIVARPRTTYDLKLVDIFLGVPYAEPPIGSFRFTPPRSPQPWSGVRLTQKFPPVCPQIPPKLPADSKPLRYEYIERLLPYLKNQSEDCLYLNIYAPHQGDSQRSLRKYPVMVFLHGQSFEWNSGNPYDGSILASYGDVVFITINFRLGILGFLRPGTRDDAASNFGLLDQIAALVWIQENIAEFGGDPNIVTLVGHGTGAILANLLLLSPVANNKGLFQRAILMSGSASSPDAIGKAPLQITKQVAHALNCPTSPDSELADCLRSRDVDSLLNVKIHKPKYVPAFAPLIDNAVILDKPLHLMENKQLLSRFSLMYGVTESEKFHSLPPFAFYGVLDKQRDEIFRDHVMATHGLEPELVISKVLEHYSDFSSGLTADFAMKNREILLDVLSDSETVAPLITTAKLHAKANSQSYMYVFTHRKAMQDYSGYQYRGTIHGEELPYILGVPLGGSKYHITGQYNIGETLFSEAMMTWWCNFAHTGNPNAHEGSSFLTDGLREWKKYKKIIWAEFNSENQTYLNLTIPPEIGSYYRFEEMAFWNNYLPNLIKYPHLANPPPPPVRHKVPRPDILGIIDKIEDSKKFDNNTDSRTNRRPYPIVDTIKTPTGDTNDAKHLSAISLVIGFGVIFLLINLMAFFYLYRKRYNLKNKEINLKRRLSEKGTNSRRAKFEKHTENTDELGHKSDSKPDLNDVIKNDKAYDNNSNFGRKSKLSRQNSNSTIDTHIKVREWIHQEIVHRCSPRFLRKTRETLQKQHQEKLTKREEEEEEEERRLQLGSSKIPIYEESPALIVRPGKKSKLPKISVAIDATPATRTESILRQVPIELAKDMESITEQKFDECAASRMPGVQFNGTRVMPRVVIVEHHHSKSDPLPMGNIYPEMSSNFSTSKIDETDYDSASSLYAKQNVKTKPQPPPSLVAPQCQTPSSMNRNVETEDIYDRVAVNNDPPHKLTPKLTTFNVKEQSGDINVTSRDSIADRNEGTTSPEEALRTIKRRKYPKVLPDIEKRRSLPVSNKLFINKPCAHSLKNYESNTQADFLTGQPPQPPPRLFGTSKSLDLADESESSRSENEPVTTNLHVGPLIKWQDCTKESDCQKVSRSAPTMIGQVDPLHLNPKCPVHGPHSSGLDPLSPIRDPRVTEGNPNRCVSNDQLSLIPSTLATSPNTRIGNPHWYRPAFVNRRHDDKKTPATSTSIIAAAQDSIVEIASRESDPIDKTERDVKPGLSEPKIVITPRVCNLLGQAGQDSNQTERDVKPGLSDPKIVITPRVGNLLGQTGHGIHHRTISNTAAACGALDSALKLETIYGGEQTIGNASAPSTPSFVDRLYQHQNILPQPPKLTAITSASPPASFSSPSSSLNEERREPKIIITPDKPVVSNLKQPKIVIKPTSSSQRYRDLKNIPKVSAIPSSESQNVPSSIKEPTMQTQGEYASSMEKPLLKEKPKSFSRIPSFSRRKPEEPIAAEKQRQLVDQISNVPLMQESPAEKKYGIPTRLKEGGKNSPDPESSSSFSDSDKGTVKRESTKEK